MRDWIIAVDFDGTIVEHMFPDVGDPVPGAIEWMRRWQAQGAKLILWTMRSPGQEFGDVLAQAVAYCRENGVEFWGVCENPDQKSWTSSPKAYANIYVDDAAAGCPLIPGVLGDRPMVDWSIIGPMVYLQIGGTLP